MMKGSFCLLIDSILLSLNLFASSCRAMGDVSDRIGRPTDNSQVFVSCLDHHPVALKLLALCRELVGFFILISGWFHLFLLIFQIGIIDPDCRLIGLHLYDGLFKVYDLIRFCSFVHSIFALLSELM